MGLIAPFTPMGTYVIRRVNRLLRSLNWYHHVMIIVTILVPLIWSVIITLWLPAGLVWQAILHLAALLGFFVLAELSVAVALKRDRSTAERFVSQEIGGVECAIGTLRQQHGDVIEQHGDLIGDLRRQIEAQDEVLGQRSKGWGWLFQGGGSQ